MNRFVIFVGLMMLASGCAPLESDYVIQDAGRQLVPVRNDLTAATQVKLGMTRQEVAAQMGQQLVFGYQQDIAGAASPEEKTLLQPYRTESVSSQGKEYVVDFYLTQIRNPDGVIAEDEITPFVFDGDVLAGKDWDFYFKLKQ